MHIRTPSPLTHRWQVLVNKVVFASGFNFPMTVTCAHFSFTVVFYRAMRAFKLFEARRLTCVTCFVTDSYASRLIVTDCHLTAGGEHANRRGVQNGRGRRGAFPHPHPRLTLSHPIHPQRHSQHSSRHSSRLSSRHCILTPAVQGSIGFMNISLNLNSVGFYQITKLAIVPCTLVAQVFGLIATSAAYSLCASAAGS